MKLVGCLSICLLLAACGKKESEPNPPPQPDPPRSSTASLQRIKYIEYPPQGILLGQGWDSFRKLGADNVCVTFDPAVVPGHDIDIRFDEVFSRHQLNKLMRLSVSGGYSGFGVSASGRASFSNSLAVDRTNTNILATIQVLKGDEFVSPALTTLTGKDPSDAVGQYSEIRLSDAALKALGSSDGKRAFSRLCGDSFVYHIRRGGRLNAYLTYAGLSEESKKSMSVSLSASGWDVKVTASTGLDSSTKDEAKLTNIRIFQSGGPLLPTPVNVAQFNESVRQFLGSTDPDLFPTKPFEVGLLRYDALSNWPRDSKLIDPEEMEDLVKFYWLFDDLRRQYSATLTSEHPHLIFQPDSWDSTAEIFAFVKDRLCKYRYEGTQGEWKYVPFDQTPPNEDKDCSPINYDPVLHNPWVLRNVLARMDAARAAALFLRNAVDGCVDKDGSLEECVSERALRKMTRTATLSFAQAPQSQLAEAFFGPRPSSAGKRKTLENEDLALFLSTFPLNATREEIRRDLDLYATKSKIMFVQGQTADTIASSIRSFSENPKSLLLAARAIAFDKYVREAGDSNEYDSTATILSYLSDSDKGEGSLWKKLSADYYALSQLSPPRIGTTTPASGATQASTTFFKAYEKALSANPATIKADAMAIRSSIRHNAARDQIRFAESECLTDLASPLCKSIADIREMLDTYDTSPLFSQKASTTTVVVGYRKQCREKWFGGGGSIYRKKCWREAVTQNLNEYLTELAETNVKF